MEQIERQKLTLTGLTILKKELAWVCGNCEKVLRHGNIFIVMIADDAPGFLADDQSPFSCPHCGATTPLVPATFETAAQAFDEVSMIRARIWVKDPTLDLGIIRDDDFDMGELPS